ncbi:MAG: hypothetical protein HZA01_05525 [Nitrospinae bacterium]|nr:hypothetical protein [Nitrospinota bacterium]
MRTRCGAAVIIALILFSTPGRVSAIEPAPRISDREIIEKLSALDAKIDKETANIRGDIKEIRADIKALQQQYADLKESTSKQSSDLKDLMLWGFGVLFAGMFTLIGFVLWDRRTALEPAIKKNKELEEKEERLEKALREYAYKEPQLAEALRNAGIM